MKFIFLTVLSVSLASFKEGPIMDDFWQWIVVAGLTFINVLIFFIITSRKNSEEVFKKEAKVILI